MAAAPWMDFLDQNFKFSTLRSNFSFKPFLSKCCRYDELFSYIDKVCVPINSSSTFSHVTQDPRPNLSEFEIQPGLNCSTSSKLTITYSYLRDSLKITEYFENGSLNAQFGRQKEPKHFEVGEYCLDVEKEMLQPLLFTCQPAPVVGGFNLWFAFIFYMSLILFMITFSLYLVMPELRKRVYEKCFLYFMGFGILTLLLIAVRAVSVTELNIKSRFITLMSIYFIVMVCYGWLHVMCIHLWRTVTSTTKVISGRSIYIYAVYACGLPIICCIFFFTDLYVTGWEMFLYRYLRGGLTSDPMLLYFVNICAVQQVINLCLFTHVGYLIWYQKQPWNENSGSGCQKHVGQQNTVISRLIRLSLLMGMDWMNVFLLNYVNSKTDLSNIFYLFYHINLCPGYVIFITFVCYKEQIINPLKEKYPKIMKVGSFAIKIFFSFVLAVFVRFVVNRWGKVGQNILVL